MTGVILATALLTSTLSSGEVIETTSAHAQATQTGHHRIGLEFGAAHVSSRDDLSTSLPYTGLITRGELRYRYDGDVAHEVALQLDTGSLKPFTERDLSLSADRMRLSLDYAVRPWSHRFGAWRVAVGGALDNDIMMTAFSGSGFVQYMGAFMLAADARAEGELLTDHTLSIGLRAPLAGYLVRPPYAMESDELWRAGAEPLGVLGDGEFGSLHNYRRVDAALSWRYDAYEHLSLLASYDLTWLDAPSPRAHVELTHALSLNAEVVF